MFSGAGAATTAPKVLGIGIPATASIVPWIARSFLQKSLNAMEADMEASRYDWGMLYIVPGDDFGLVTSKLKEKQWDIVMVGSEFSGFHVLLTFADYVTVGLRKTDSVITLFEKIVNAVHKELPEAKFAFNTSIEKTREAIDRGVIEESK